ncbi:MAG: outer membrane protein transport protein [Gammaproteobacteria bacterium]|nr:outer membrane protein transport protein [Gammaproteobacteria bacterium]
MTFRRILRWSSVLLSMCFSSSILASDFNTPFINVSDLGTAYAGWAAAAEDASTAYSNPAGLVKIQDYQFVLPLVGIIGGTTFSGSTTTPPFPFFFTRRETGSAHDRLEVLIPSTYFSAPVTPRLTFGWSTNSPFGLGSDYGKNSLVRFLGTEGKVVVIDTGPSLGFRVTDDFSVGAGFDVHFIQFTLNNMLGPPVAFPFDAEFKNHLAGSGYGWHAGILYQFLPCMRFGASFNSKAWLHASGDSKLYVPLPPNVFHSGRLRADAPIPARAQFSFYYDVAPRWAVMGTVFYTHWGVFDKVTLKNAVTLGGEVFTLDIPFDYHHTYDYSLGLKFRATRKLSLRTGVQYLDTPINDKFRSVVNPVGSAIILAAGLRYQSTPCVSFDLGYGHAFFKENAINLVTPLTSAVGHVKTQTNSFGVQMNWSFPNTRW